MKYDYITETGETFKALALVYVQAQNLSGQTPEEILDMYDEALTRIHNHYEENC